MFEGFEMFEEFSKPETGNPKLFNRAKRAQRS
jgi:hypothetical protein